MAAFRWEAVRRLLDRMDAVTVITAEPAPPPPPPLDHKRQ